MWDLSSSTFQHFTKNLGVYSEDTQVALGAMAALNNMETKTIVNGMKASMVNNENGGVTNQYLESKNGLNAVHTMNMDYKTAVLTTITNDTTVDAQKAIATGKEMISDAASLLPGGRAFKKISDYKEGFDEHFGAGDGSSPKGEGVY